MKTMEHVLLIALLALLAGCTTTFRPWKLSEIQEGMNRAQVVDILGEPDSVEMKDDSEFLHYSYRENINSAATIDDIRMHDVDGAMQEQQIQTSFKEYKYVVKMVDGKVQTYKELQN